MPKALHCPEQSNTKINTKTSLQSLANIKLDTSLKLQFQFQCVSVLARTEVDDVSSFIKNCFSSRRCEQANIE